MGQIKSRELLEQYARAKRAEKLLENPEAQFTPPPSFLTERLVEFVVEYGENIDTSDLWDVICELIDRKEETQRFKEFLDESR